MPYGGGTIHWVGSARPKLPSEIVRDDANGAALDDIAMAVREVRPLVFTGGVGTGKTTLMAEVDFWLSLRFPYSDAAGGIYPHGTAWTDAEAYAEDVRAGWIYAKKFRDWSRRYSAVGIASSVPVLFLDDLGVESTANVEHLVVLLRERYTRGLPTWITTNLDIAGLRSRYDERTVSRLFEAAYLVELSGADRRLRRAG